MVMLVLVLKMYCNLRLDSSDILKRWVGIYNSCQCFLKQVALAVIVCICLSGRGINKLYQTD